MKAVLNYFVRKAFAPLRERLLAIQSNIQEVYEWLYPKVSGSADGTIPRRMPIVEREDASSSAQPVSQNTDNLFRYLALLNGRKISNGYADGSAANDGLPNGVSLARLLCDSTISPTTIIDDNVGWDYTDGTCNTMLSIFPLTTNLVLGCKTTNGNGKMISNNSVLQRVELPYLERYGKPTDDSTNGIIANCPNVTELLMPNLSYIHHYSRNNGAADYAMVGNMANLQKVVLGTLITFTGEWTGFSNFFVDCPNLIHLEIGQGSSASMNLYYWNPTDKGSVFLSNFQQYIADRVADRTGQSALTLTLSAEVYAALEQQEGKTILATLTNKNWTVASA